MRIAAAVFLVMHGFAHLVGFFGAWRIAGVPNQATLLDRFVHLGSAGTKLFGILWLLLALAYVLTAVLVILRAAPAIPVGMVVSLVSLAACLAALPAAKFGVLVDLIVIAGLFLAARQTPAY